MINARLIKELNANKNDLDSDFRAEVIAANLIKQGVDPKKIIIAPNGTIGKSSAKDVESIRLRRFGDGPDDNYIYIVTNRAGIYDTLPEGLFHKQYSYGQGDMRAQAKKSRAEERKARQFFLPFEVQLNKYGTDISYREDLGIYENIKPVIDQLAINWPIFNLLDQRQSVLFLYAIPTIHQMRNSHEWVSSFMSLLLGVLVLVKLKTKTVAQRAYPDFSLNEARLGVSSVLGGVSWETIPILKVEVGPIPADKLDSFVSRAKNDILLDELFQWLFDCQIPVEKEVLVDNEPKKRPTTYYLGTNTFLR